jgi:peptidylprolyl isomerase
VCPLVNYFNDFQALRSRAAFGLVTVAAAVLIAGCGSSSSSNSTIGVGVENKADEALATSTSSASTPTGATPTTSTATTPTSGPLSKEPKVTPPSGPAPAKLVTKEIIPGTGAEAKAGESVTVNYLGVLYNGGKEFDASWKRNEPFNFVLGRGQVIPGWDQGVAGMKVGGRRELIIPSALAYGAKGSGSTIPANAPLVFVVDLLGT